MLARDANVFAEMVSYCDDVADKISWFKVDYQRWTRDRYVRDSILFSIGHIGGRAGHLSEAESLEEFPDVPWKDVMGLGNFIFHHYQDVDLDSAWESTTKSVPALRNRLLQNPQVSDAYERLLADAHDETIADVIDSLPLKVVDGRHDEPNIEEKPVVADDRDARLEVPTPSDKHGGDTH